jgi:hypothetical protein
MKAYLLASALALAFSGAAYADVAASSASSGSLTSAATIGFASAASSAGSGASNFSAANHFGTVSTSHSGGGSSSATTSGFGAGITVGTQFANGHGFSAN